MSRNTGLKRISRGLLALALASSGSCWAVDSAIVQEILDGSELFINQKQAAPKDVALAPQTVSTGDSRGQLMFSTGAAGRINRFSVLRLGASCFLVEKGQILVSGKQNGCTRSARLSVRGTNYLIEVREDGSAEISVLEGTVDVQPLQDGQPTGSPPTQVEAGQKVTISAKGVILALLRLTAGDYSSILSGPLFSGFSSPLPALTQLESYVRSAVPGVSLPGVPATPQLPSFPRPRFGPF